MRFGLDLDRKRLAKYLEEADRRQVEELIMVCRIRKNLLHPALRAEVLISQCQIFDWLISPTGGER